MPTASARWCGASCAALDAGLDTPQFSIHRGKLHTVLLEAVRERLGDRMRVRTGCRLVSFAERGDRVVARFEQRDAGDTFEAEGDVLVGADGIHSAVRAAFYPDEGPPVWNGMMLWRGAADWPVYVDGRTMVISGGMGQKFVFYPIHADPAAPERRLTNWAVMARHRRWQRDCRRGARTGTGQAHGRRWSRSCAIGSGWISSIRWR